MRGEAAVVAVVPREARSAHPLDFLKRLLFQFFTHGGKIKQRATNAWGKLDHTPTYAKIHNERSINVNLKLFLHHARPLLPAESLSPINRAGPTRDGPLISSFGGKPHPIGRRNRLAKHFDPPSNRHISIRRLGRRIPAFYDISRRKEILSTQLARDRA